MYHRELEAQHIQSLTKRIGGQNKLVKQPFDLIVQQRNELLKEAAKTRLMKVSAKKHQIKKAKKASKINTPA